MEALHIDELARRFAAGLPGALGALKSEVECNFRAVLQGAAGKLDLASRSEFEVQSRVLERARERIATLEARISELEARVARPPS
jgi:BMFP domain-containing protein YqiC